MITGALISASLSKYARPGVLKLPPEFEAIPFAYPGKTSDTFVEKVTAIEFGNLDCVILSLGTNDVSKCSKSPSNFAGAIQDFIRNTSFIVGCKVCSLFPRNDNHMWAARTNRVNNLLRTRLKKMDMPNLELIFLDNGIKFKASSKRRNETQEILAKQEMMATSNGLHFSEKGLAVFSDL